MRRASVDDGFGHTVDDTSAPELGDDLSARIVDLLRADGAVHSHSGELDREERVAPDIGAVAEQLIDRWAVRSAFNALYLTRNDLSTRNACRARVGSAECDVDPRVAQDGALFRDLGWARAMLIQSCRERTRKQRWHVLGDDKWDADICRH